MALSAYKRSAISKAVGKSVAVGSERNAAAPANVVAEASDKAKQLRSGSGSLPARVSSQQPARTGDTQPDSATEQTPSVGRSADWRGSEANCKTAVRADQQAASTAGKASVTLSAAAKASDGIGSAGGAVDHGTDCTVPPPPPPLCCRAMPLELAVDLAQSTATDPAGTAWAPAVAGATQPDGEQRSHCDAGQPAAAATQRKDQPRRKGPVPAGALEADELQVVSNKVMERLGGHASVSAQAAAHLKPAADAGKDAVASAAVTQLSRHTQVQYRDIAEPRRPAEKVSKPMSKAKAKAFGRKKRDAKPSAALEPLPHATDNAQVTRDFQPATGPAKLFLTRASLQNIAMDSVRPAIPSGAEGLLSAAASRAVPQAAAEAADSHAAHVGKETAAASMRRKVPVQVPEKATAMVHILSAFAPPKPEQPPQAARQEAAVREALMRRLNRQARSLIEACPRLCWLGSTASVLGAK